MTEILFNEITLPTLEETSINVKSGGVTVSIDIHDIQAMRTEAVSFLKTSGVPGDRNAFIDLMQKAFNDKFGLKLGKQAVMSLIIKSVEIEDNLKKKFFPDSESVESMESPQDSENKSPITDPTQTNE